MSPAVAARFLPKEPLFSRPPERLEKSKAHYTFVKRFTVLIGMAAIVAILPPLYAAAAVAALAAFIILLSRPFAALCCLAFTVPFDSIFAVRAGDLAITITNFVVFAATAAWLTQGISQGRIRLGTAPWRPALLLYGAVLFLSATQATDFVLSAKELLKWGQLTCVYCVGVSIIKTRKDMKILLLIIFAAVLTEGIVDIGQVLLHTTPSSFARGGFLRAGGTFDQPNPLAGYLNMVLPLAVACFILRAFDRRLMFIVALGAAGGVLATLSRGGELGTLSALCTLAAVLSQRARSILFLIAIVAACVIGSVTAGLIPSSVTDPYAQGFGIANVDVINPTPDTWNVAERLAHMEAGLGMWNDHLLLGVGIGNYPAVYKDYRVATTTDVWKEPLGHSHNYYINIGAEAGILGEIAWFILLTSAIVIGVQSYRRATDPLCRAIAIGGVCVMIGFAFHMFFDNLFVHGLEVQIALVMVLVTLAGNKLQEQETLKNIPTYSF